MFIIIYDTYPPELIDSSELNQFILEQSKKRDYTITEEIIDLVLDLEMEFLDSNKMFMLKLYSFNLATYLQAHY